MMNQNSLESCSTKVWKQTLAKVNKGVIFTDSTCAEIIHWHGGMGALLNAGAKDVREFSSFESAPPSREKGIFIVSSCLDNVTRQIIKDIITASKFKYVIIITAASPFLHLFSRTGSFDGNEASVFSKFEDDVLTWMGNMNYTVEVIHMPLFGVNLSPDAFVTPGFKNLFPLLNSDLPRLLAQNPSLKGIKSVRELESQNLPKELQILYKSFISQLNSLMDQLNVQEECFSVGGTSKLLATGLANYPPAKNRRKTAQKKASLVLIDRTLDLANVCHHQNEVLLDKIIASLPRLPGHSIDVQVNLAPLCNVHSSAESTILPGNLASCNSPNQNHLQTLIYSKQKEGLMEINRHLVEAATKEKLPVSLSGKPGRITPDQLLSSLNLFRGNYKTIQTHLNVLQVAMATSECLKCTKHSRNEKLSAEEKLLIQGIGNEDSQSPLSLLVEKMSAEWDKPIEERIITLDDLFTLTIYIYSLMGEDAAFATEEDELKEMFVNGIMFEKDNLSPLTKEIIGDVITEEVVSAVIDDIFVKLRAIAQTRENLKLLRSVIEPATTLSPASMKPFIKQLVDLTFDLSKTDSVDIEHRSSGFSELLKSGFGLFSRAMGKPRPSDAPLIIIFIVGGVTANELKIVKDMVSVYKDKQVIVGSTQLVEPLDIVKATLCNNNLNPDLS